MDPSGRRVGRRPSPPGGLVDESVNVPIHVHGLAACVDQLAKERTSIPAQLWRGPRGIIQRGRDLRGFQSACEEAAL